MNRLFVIAATSLVLSLGCGPRFSAGGHFDHAVAPGARVAIMPFENLSGRENASEKITEYFVLSLQRITGLALVELGQTYEQMRRHRIRSSTFLTSAQIDSLSTGLEINYIITGTVLEYAETDNTYLGKIPQVSVNFRLIDCASGKTVWTGVSNARGDQSETVFGLGAVRSREELARRVTDQAVDQISKLVRQ